MPSPEPEVSPEDYKHLHRYDVPGQARAINFSCFRNQSFLTSERACQWLAEALERFLPLHDTDLWAYCFMPTHVHLVLFPHGEPCMEDLLASMKKSVTNRAVAWVKRNAPAFLVRMRDEQPNGDVAYRFWQRGGGYDRNHNAGHALWNAIDYVHNNPVEDGLVKRPEDWKWSSAATYINKSLGPIPLNTRALPPRR